MSELDEIVKRGNSFGLTSELTEKERRDLMQRLYSNEEYCYCGIIFGHSDVWGVQSYEDDELLYEYEYYRKYDFKREGPKAKANMYKCPICRRAYTDAPLMA